MFGLCTCCESCIIYYDNFDRPDKDRLDPPWLNEGTEFSVSNYVAVPNFAESNAILNVPHPKSDNSMVVYIHTVDEPIEKNVVYRLILNAVIDDPVAPSTNSTCDTFYFAEFVRNGTNDSIIRLGVSSSGGESILKQDTIMGLTGTQREFYAKIADYEFCAGVSNAVLSLVGMVIDPEDQYSGGIYSGIGVRLKDNRSDLGDVDMDDPETPVVKILDFTFEEHFQTNKSCGMCLCKCDSQHIFRETLNVRIWPDPDDCVRLDLLEPCEFEIHWDRVNAYWEGEGMCCEGNYYSSVPSGQNWKLQFSCPNRNYYGQFDPMLSTAALLEGCLNSCGKPQGTCGSLGNPVSASCEPLEITFGPVFVSGMDLTCLCSSSGDIFNRGGCNYYVTVYV